MSYDKLVEILLDNDVYNKIKQNENHIYDLIPELKVCKGFNQNNKWHIYDVYEHILHVILGVYPNKYLRISALFHDIGKPLTYSQDSDGIGHFYNHWNISIEIFEKYKDKFNLSLEEADLIKSLIFYHDVNIEKMNDYQLKNMLNSFSMENVKLLFALKKADLLAQSPDYHYLQTNLKIQEEKIKKLKLKKNY